MVFLKKLGMLIGFLVLAVYWPVNRSFGQAQAYSSDGLPITVPAGMPKDPVVDIKKEDLDGKPLIDFTVLASFNYDYPDVDGDPASLAKDKRKKPVYPQSVLKLNGQEVAIPGFMVPMDQDEDGDKSTYFILVRNQMSCCFGVAPGLNEWVSVRMDKGQKALIEMDRPVVVLGTLDVGEVYNPDSGWSFYRMKGEKVIIAGKKKVWFQ